MSLDTRRPKVVQGALIADHRRLSSTDRLAWLRQSPVLSVLAACLTALTVTFAVACASGPIRDPDTLWHVNAGRYLLSSGRFVGADPWGKFSARPWVLHEWLSEVVMYGAYQVGGLRGLAALHALAVAALALLVLRLMRSYAGPLVGSAVALAVLFAMAGSLGPRPQVASFALLAVVLQAWLRTTRDLRPRWWLIPMTWVWACLHGLWLMGVVLGAVVTVGLLMDRRLGRAVAWRLAAVPLGMLLAAGMTPVGPRLLATPFTVRVYARFVQEWDRPSLTEPSVIICLGFLALAMLIWTRRGPVSFWRLGLWALALVSTVQYGRTVALGALIAGCLAAEAIGALRTSSGMAMPSTGVAGATGSAAVRLTAQGRPVPQVFLDLAVCGLLLAAALPSQVRATGELGGVPSHMSTQLSRLPQGTVVLNEYELGGWLMWSQPQLEPVIDPRTEVYDVSYVQRYTDARGVVPGWRNFVADTGATVAILDRKLPLTGALQETLHWRVTDHDGDWLLLEAPEK